jgi:hypothetical protein
MLLPSVGALECDATVCADQSPNHGLRTLAPPSLPEGICVGGCGPQVEHSCSFFQVQHF